MDVLSLFTHAHSNMMLCLMPKPLLPVGAQAHSQMWVLEDAAVLTVAVDYCGHSEIVIRRPAGNMQVQ